MTGYAWGARSLRNLDGIHPDLRKLADAVLARNPHDLTVLDGGGLRTPQQAQANAANGTGVLNSRHLTGDAVDLVTLTNGRVDWQNLRAFRETAETVATVAAELGIPIVQGCDWDCDGIMGEAKEWDWPHVQLPWPHQVAKAEALLRARRKLLGLP